MNGKFKKNKVPQNIMKLYHPKKHLFKVLCLPKRYREQNWLSCDTNKKKTKLNCFNFGDLTIFPSPFLLSDRTYVRNNWFGLLISILQLPKMEQIFYKSSFFLKIISAFYFCNAIWLSHPNTDFIWVLDKTLLTKLGDSKQSSKCTAIQKALFYIRKW